MLSQWPRLNNTSCVPDGKQSTPHSLYQKLDRVYSQNFDTISAMQPAGQQKEAEKNRVENTGQFLSQDPELRIWQQEIADQQRLKMWDIRVMAG